MGAASAERANGNGRDGAVEGSEDQTSAKRLVAFVREFRDAAGSADDPSHVPTAKQFPQRSIASTQASFSEWQLVIERRIEDMRTVKKRWSIIEVPVEARRAIMSIVMNGSNLIKRLRGCIVQIVIHTRPVVGGRG